VGANRFQMSRAFRRRSDRAIRRAVRKVAKSEVKRLAREAREAEVVKQLFMPVDAQEPS
jgi:hypothetical protein